MNEARFVILGGGMVAGYAAKEFVDAEVLKPGDLAIVSADTYLPYERPPLSKSFLAGKDTEESIRINPEELYRRHDVEVRLCTPVTAVDTARRKLKLKSGGEFGFEKLIVATGARPRTLDIPGSGFHHIHYLRSLGDSKAIRDNTGTARRAVVIGGGFIAMEVAAVLAQARLDVAMVLREDRIWKRLFSPEMSAFFESYYTARGVRFYKNTEVAEFRGGGTVREAALRTGTVIPCALAVAGLGVVPETEVLNSSGIEVNDGVVVNEYLETNLPGIYAAGDVANYQDVLFGKRRRVEHWDNAVSQGRHCARQLIGERAPFRHVPYFFSDVFDLSYEYWGDAAVADEVVHRGDLSSNSFSAWWLRQGRVVAAFAMNRPDEERDSAPKWIESQQAVSRDRLGEAQRPIAEAVE